MGNRVYLLGDYNILLQLLMDEDDWCVQSYTHSIRIVQLATQKLSDSGSYHVYEQYLNTRNLPNEVACSYHNWRPGAASS